MTKQSRTAQKIGKILNGYLALHMRQKKKAMTSAQINAKRLDLFSLVLAMQKVNGKNIYECAHLIGHAFCNID